MFAKEDIKRWRRFIHKEMDKAGADARVRAAGLVVCTVSEFGTNVEIVSELSGQPVADVRAMLKRMRQQRMLSGQTLRVAWHQEGFAGWVALMVDAMTVAGDLYRPVDEKRSAVLKGKAGRKPGVSATPRRRLAAVGMYQPKKVKSNPLYGLAEWDKKKP